MFWWACLNVFVKLIVIKLKMEIDIMFTIDYFV